MFNYFEKKRIEKFKNQLKYGQDKKPVHTVEALSDALAIGDEEKAIEILGVLVERKTKELKGK